MLLHNFYVPAGGDEPDPEINPKFRHKLDFVEEMRTVPADDPRFSGSILVGDLNIAPLENDVWSHKQLLNVVSHTPVETTSFEAMRKGGGWVDLMRHNDPGRAEDLHLVELPRPGLAGLGPRPPARPCLVVRRLWSPISPTSRSCARRAAGTARPTTCR